MNQTEKELAILSSLQGHATSFGDSFHNLAKLRGWWNDPKTNEPLELDSGLISSKLLLIHSEISEATEGFRKSKADDHLPHRSSLEVELADALIRIFDLAGAMKLDVIGAAVEKSAYNARRADHDPANRAAQGGKKF